MSRISQDQREKFREQIINFTSCPLCGVPKGSPCQGRKGPRKQQHRERWNAGRR